MESCLSMNWFIFIAGRRSDDGLLLPFMMLRRYCGLSFCIYSTLTFSTLAICSKCTSRSNITVSVFTGSSATIGQMLWSQ